MRWFVARASVRHLIHAALFYRGHARSMVVRLELRTLVRELRTAYRKLRL